MATQDEILSTWQMLQTTDEGLSHTRLFIMQLERFEPQSKLLPRLYEAHKGWVAQRKKLYTDLIKMGVKPEELEKYDYQR